jgi:hypothetical protein
MAESYPNCPNCGKKVVCPRCGETATYQTPDKTFWDSQAHYWRCECFGTLAVKPEGNWGLLFPLTAEQWYLQIKDRMPAGLNEHAKICFVAANYEEYCRNFVVKERS